ncbi:unnamed protein product [Polarella glacialis]|uniref:Uncharacterized protein n=1 Tax=Polarella glacialis TaxID=89957 RepID=A0A813DDQ0_POLGL|nr:unnamed protein product [Polarella glacialis]
MYISNSSKNYDNNNINNSTLLFIAAVATHMPCTIFAHHNNNSNNNSSNNNHNNNTNMPCPIVAGLFKLLLFGVVMHSLHHTRLSTITLLRPSCMYTHRYIDIHVLL